MMNINYVCVYESLQHIPSDTNKLISVMDTNETKSGFTKLKLVYKSDF